MDVKIDALAGADALSPLLDLAGDWIAAAVAWPLRPTPVAIAVATLGESLAPAPPYQLHQVESPAASSPRRSG
jgi:hypothetical protein